MGFLRSGASGAGSLSAIRSVARAFARPPRPWTACAPRNCARLPVEALQRWPEGFPPEVRRRPERPATERPVSRVLFRGRVAPTAAKIIPLGRPLLGGSSTLTRTPRPGRSRNDRADRSRRCPYSSLLREGLAPPPVTRLSRVGSYPTISPLPVPLLLDEKTAIGGVFSAALSLGSPRVAVNDLPVLWSPDFPPVNGSCSPATFQPPSAGSGILSRVRQRATGARGIRFGHLLGTPFDFDLLFSSVSIRY